MSECTPSSWKVSIWLPLPRSWMEIWASPSTCFMKRTHRLQRMHRLRLSSRVGPKSTSPFTPSPSNTRRGKSIRLATGAELVRVVLQRALAALVADGAVERVVDQQELEHRRAGLDDFRRPRIHHHPVGADRRARGLQLRHLLDADDADAARAFDAERGVVAVVRDVDAGLEGRLQHGLALLDGQGMPVYRQRHGVHDGADNITGTRRAWPGPGWRRFAAAGPLPAPAFRPPGRSP